MGFEDFVKNISGPALAKSFVLRQVQRQVGPKIAELANGIGPANLKWLLDNNKDLSLFLRPEVAAKLQSDARQSKYKSLIGIITPADLRAMLPDWTQQILKAYGPHGDAWWQSQCIWFLSFFT